MKWDKPNFSKSYVDVKPKSEGWQDLTSFMLGNHAGKLRFPDSTLFIGTGFEIGGVHNDWGFGVFRLVGGKMQEIASARTLDSAIAQARMRLTKESTK